MGAVSRQLRFGYKVSAEQFSPSDLLDFTVVGGAVRLRHRRDQRSLSTLAAHRRSRAVLAGVAGRGRSGDQPHRARHQRAHARPSAITRRSSRRRWARSRSLFPGRIWLGVGTGESMNEAPLDIEWPDTKERFARLKEAVTLIQTLLDERPGHLRRHVLPDAERHHLRPAGDADPDLHRRRGSVGRTARRPRRRRAHLHQRQGHGAVLRHAAPGGDGGRTRSRARPGRCRADHRDEGLVRQRSRPSARGHAALGSAGAVSRGEDRRRGRGRDGAPRRRAFHRASRRAAGSCRQIPTSTWNASVRTSTSDSPI